MRISFVTSLVFTVATAFVSGNWSEAAEPPRPADEAANGADMAFCKEVLILHHSHVDVGYTHPQSMYWELQKDYLNEALDLLDRTESWPDDVRPRWTAETTAPVMRWLQTASAGDRERLQRHIRSGRFGISGFEYNTTPLSPAEGLARQLSAVRTLREQFGAKICSANQHNVTGIPWTAVDLLLDSDIELLIMAINLHLSGTPMPRPAVYRWKGPSGREILVMNGEHYSMFDQWTEPASRDLDHMQAGLNRYLTHLKGLNYPYDFVYLTATCAPLAYDNSPPNHDLPELVRRWNDEHRQPRLRFVTPAELLERIRRIPRESLPVVTGDWTDYWNFGCGSSAAETRLCRRMTAAAAVCDLLRAGRAADLKTETAMRRLWSDIHLYNEHTWGAANSLDQDNPNVVTQWHLKAAPVYDGWPLADYLLRRQLQTLSGNPYASWKTAGVMVVNPTRAAAGLLRLGGRTPARREADRIATGPNPPRTDRAAARPSLRSVPAGTVQLAGHPLVAVDSGARVRVGQDRHRLHRNRFLPADVGSRDGPSHQLGRQATGAGADRPRRRVGLLPAGPRTAQRQPAECIPCPQRRGRALRPHRLEARLGGDAHQLHGAGQVLDPETRSRGNPGDRRSGRGTDQLPAAHHALR